MRQNAVIVAAFVYQTANRDEKLPRKPLPRRSPPDVAPARSTDDGDGRWTMAMCDLADRGISHLSAGTPSAIA